MNGSAFGKNGEDGGRRNSNWWSSICGRDRESINPPITTRKRSVKIPAPVEPMPPPPPSYMPKIIPPSDHRTEIKKNDHSYNPVVVTKNEPVPVIVHREPPVQPVEPIIPPPPVVPRIPTPSVAPRTPTPPRYSPPTYQKASPPEQPIVSNRFNANPTPTVSHTQHSSVEIPERRTSVREMANRLSAMNLGPMAGSSQSRMSPQANRFNTSPTKSAYSPTPQRVLNSNIHSKEVSEERPMSIRERANQLQGMNFRFGQQSKSPSPSPTPITAAPKPISNIPVAPRAVPPPPPPPPALVKGPPKAPPLPPKAPPMPPKAPPMPPKAPPMPPKQLPPLSRAQASNQFSRQQQSYQMPQKSAPEPPNYSSASSSRVTIDYDDLPSVKQRRDKLDALIRSGGFAFPQSRGN